MKDEEEELQDYTQAQLCLPQCYIYFVRHFMCIMNKVSYYETLILL
jgi:hypothetical protein